MTPTKYRPLEAGERPNKLVEIELLQGRRTKHFVLCVDDTLICGLKDGFGYDVVHTWKEPRERWASTLEVLSEINEDAK